MTDLGLEPRLAALAASQWIRLIHAFLLQGFALMQTKSMPMGRRSELGIFALVTSVHPLHAKPNISNRGPRTDLSFSDQGFDPPDSAPERLRGGRDPS